MCTPPLHTSHCYIWINLLGTYSQGDPGQEPPAVHGAQFGAPSARDWWVVKVKVKVGWVIKVGWLVKVGWSGLVDDVDVDVGEGLMVFDDSWFSVISDYCWLSHEIQNLTTYWFDGKSMARWVGGWSVGGALLLWWLCGWWIGLARVSFRLQWLQPLGRSVDDWNSRSSIWAIRGSIRL